MQSRKEEDGPQVLARAGGRRVQTSSNDTRIRRVPSSPPSSSSSSRPQLYKRSTTTTSRHHRHRFHIRPYIPRHNPNDDHVANGGDAPTRRRDSRLPIRVYAQLLRSRASVTPPVTPRTSARYQRRGFCRAGHRLWQPCARIRERCAWGRSRNPLGARHGRGRARRR